LTASLAAEGLGFRHPGAGSWALQDLTLSVAAGEVLAVVGPSGSGKTTLLRLVCGLLSPTAGRVLLDGADASGVRPERRPVAMVFQGFALFPHLTVRENIGFGLTVRRVARAERVRRAEQAAATLHVEGLLDRLPGQLSGGERQRVALARALVRDPRVFCLDEPLSSLDPVLRVEARRALSRLLRADDRCAVYVTHDQSEALTVGDRVAVLREGRLEQLATPRELHARPATAFVARFVGTPPMSLLPAVAGRAGPVVPAGACPEGALLGVRAEDVAVGEGTPLVVREVEDAGHEQLVALDVDGADLLARVPLSTQVRVGASLQVRVDPADVRVYDGATGRLLP
jgi:ABC-type sugar transport system ATPase subunit